jgi:hypothetical protein
MPFVLLVVGASAPLARDARAEKVVDEDGEFAAMPRRSIAIGIAGHGTRLGGRSESGFGPSLELALGRERWQYFVEGGFATAGLDAWTTGVADMRVDGRMLRGGLGTRWLARQFRDGSGAIELFLSSLVGVQRFSLDDGTRLTRPEIAVGFGLQGRMLERPRFGFRLDARVLFTPHRDDEASTGFMGGVALVW